MHRQTKILSSYFENNTQFSSVITPALYTKTLLYLGIRASYRSKQVGSYAQELSTYGDLTGRHRRRRSRVEREVHTEWIDKLSKNIIRLIMVQLIVVDIRQSCHQLYLVAMKQQNPTIRDKMPITTNENLVLVCGAHDEDLPFLSHDSNLGERFGTAMGEIWITAYLIPASWTNTICTYPN
ncbi:hypothetical protein TWF506_003031 [Arthrobotrys conoides]|uniref:Uncharacterized protein n=1 Tax=Arthrobotrys conoides TaxID=74498 RepID=A0AAN8P6T7_9PEZI